MSWVAGVTSGGGFSSCDEDGKSRTRYSGGEVVDDLKLKLSKRRVCF
jgi:hypothetical protein